MITLNVRNPDDDAVPHAIVWRPVEYFCGAVRTESDDLDEFKFATYSVGNEFNFEIRCYNGHNKYNSTLFFAESVKDEHTIKQYIKRVLAATNIPVEAVAWQRGTPFKYGVIERSNMDRLREPEARILILKLLSARVDSSADMTWIKNNISKLYDFSTKDKMLSSSRKNEAIWKQIVGNVRSHENSRNGLFKQGFALITNNGMKLTEQGLDYLKSIGYV